MIPGTQALGTTDSMRSWTAPDSARSTIDVTARFGQGSPAASPLTSAVPNFGGSPTDPAAKAIPPGPVARFGGLAPLTEGRPAAGGELLSVEPLGTSDVSSVNSEAAGTPGSVNRLPTQYELATPVIMQELTQNLRKTMVGLSNEVKARENEDWRLEQGFTQLDSRRELMCVQLHTKYEQTKNEYEALSRNVVELQGRSDHFKGQTSEAEQRFQEYSAQIQAQSEDTRRISLLATNLQSETSSLKALLERLQEKQASLEAKTGAVEAKTGAAIARLEATPREPQGTPPAHAALQECMERQALLGQRCDQLEDADVARKAEAGFLRQSVVECKTLADKLGQFEKRTSEVEAKTAAQTVKMDSMQDSLSHVQALLQVAEEHQRGHSREVEAQHAGQKAQTETLQENLSQLQARLQQQRLVEDKQLEQLDAQCAGHAVRIESLQESVGQMQAWLQKQSLIEEKRAQIDAYNAAHRAETDDLRSTVKQLEQTVESQGPVDARTVALDARESSQKAELESMAKSVHLLTDALEQLRANNEEVRIGTSARIEERCATLEARLADASAQQRLSVDGLRDIVGEVRGVSQRVEEKNIFLESRLADCDAQQKVASDSLRDSLASASASLRLEDVNTLLESRFAESNAQHNIAVDKLRDTIGEIQASSHRFEAKLQDFNAVVASQDERLKVEIGVLQQAKQDQQVRLDTLQSRSDILQAQVQATSACEKGVEAAESQRLTALITAETQMLAGKIATAEAQTSNHAKETVSLRRLAESLQGRMEAFQTQSENNQAKLLGDFSRECEAVMNTKLQGISNESKAMEQLFQKLETSAQALRNFVEAETSGAQKGLQRLDVEISEDRRRRAEEVKRLETKDAEQQVVLAELRSRLDLELDVSRTQLVAADNAVEKGAQSGVQIANLRAQAEALQSQQDAMRAQLHDVQKSQETRLAETQSLEARLAEAEKAQAKQAATMTQAPTPSPVSGAAASDLERILIQKFSEYQADWQISFEEERASSLEKVKQLGRTMTEEARTQASTQARVVVQNMLSQELDAWRQQLNAVSNAITATPDSGQMPSKTPRAGPIDDDDGRMPEPPGLAEAVRRLDDRVASQRREAAALDELLRSELEVQRRQQSLTTTTLQTVQDRLQMVEDRTEAIRGQMEETLMERQLTEEIGDGGTSTPGGRSGMSGSTSGAARFQSALHDIAEVVRDPALHNAQSGDDIHRRIKALSAKMAACKDGGPMQAGPVTSRGERLDDTVQFDALNMPQALQDLMPSGGGGSGSYAFRPPSNERTKTSLTPGSPNAGPRGPFAFRQLSPSGGPIGGRGSISDKSGPPPQSSYGVRDGRQLSPGAQRGGRNDVGGISPRRQQTPGRAVIPESRIQRITSNPGGSSLAAPSTPSASVLTSASAVSRRVSNATTGSSQRGSSRTSSNIDHRGQGNIS